jgi:rod shape-determining protein MreD
MLTAMPLPDWAAILRPFWVSMVLVYWCMALPQRVGIATGWLVGLLVDVLTGALLGQHAASLAIVAFMTLSAHQRIRVFPLGQQAMVVGLILAAHLAVILFVRVLTSAPPIGFEVLLPLLSSMILWPWLFIILRDVRRRFNVS